MAEGGSAQRAILTFSTPLMRKVVYLRRYAVKATAASLRIARGVRAVRDAHRARAVLPAPSCVLVPPVPLHKKGAGGMLRAQTSRLADRIMMARRSPDRTAMRRRAVLVRVLAARSRPVIPPGRERTAERAQRQGGSLPRTGTQQAVVFLANAGVMRGRGQPVPHCVPRSGRAVAV